MTASFDTIEGDRQQRAAVHVYDLSGRKIPRMTGSSYQDPGIFGARIEDRPRPDRLR